MIFETLRDSPSLLASLKRESFLRSGLSLIESGACPFCDAEWERALLRDHVQGKLAEAKQASSLKDELRMAAQPVEEYYRDIEARIVSILGHAEGLDSSLSCTALKKFAEDLKDRRTMLQSLSDIETSIRQTTTVTGDRSGDVDDELSRLKDAVTALPELSKDDAARDQLTICQDRLETYQNAKRASDQAAKATGWAFGVAMSSVQASNSACIRHASHY
jgi:hypothetical protein